MTSALHFHDRPADLHACEALLVIGRRERLSRPDVRARLPAAVRPEVWQAMLDSGDGGDLGRIASSFTGGAPARILAGLLPEPCSRHASPSRAGAIPALVRGAGRGRLGVLLALDHADHAFASALGVARGLPTWAPTPRNERGVEVVMLGPEGVLPVADRWVLGAAAVRHAAHWVDTPPDQLGPDALLAAAAAIARDLPGVSLHTVRGDALREQGLHLLHAVGRAAAQAPALVVLDYTPANVPDAPHHAWVGKGICYDTGGLSIKPRASMPGMKMDMGGAAAALAAFDAAVRLGAPQRLTLVLCIAENAVGPGAIRPDDVVQGYSGRTVEINNTDAEGRLVLADGLAWVVRHRNPAVIVDIATLTGAQSAAVGKGIAAVYTPSAELEAAAVRAGLAAGEPCHPLPYVPEWWRAELGSAVADMRNSAKNRDNAGSAVAGQFLAEHLGAAAARWLHLDIAGPVGQNGRGTGFGVGLLLGLLALSSPGPSATP